MFSIKIRQQMSKIQNRNEPDLTQPSKLLYKWRIQADYYVEHFDAGVKSELEPFLIISSSQFFIG